ncbi:MAG TPA: protein kinase [Chlamydiales bacterium]|nr:protein kinase [Chlamydiales bacterium]
MKKDQTPTNIGPYAILRLIGKGGMGEVFLAKDPICDREVALKRIKPELQEKKLIQERFLREARVTSHLTHPSIIPILNIHSELPDIYYTMPYAEGETLRRILSTTREQERIGKQLHPIGRSIPALTRIFLQICQAIAHTHSKGILHRDLKPENIIVGKYGEVMILDWGLANFIDQISKETPPKVKKSNAKDLVTRPGKVAGTLAYMAPELITGKLASIQTDIYALGVILYQMLTLQIPFQRKTIASFRKQMSKEEIIPPMEMAPHREIPHQLAAVAVKCLSPNIAHRYKHVEELIADIKHYVDGKPEWVLMASLDIQNSEDWLLEENILLAKHIAITKNLASTAWAALRISRKTFVDNIKIEAEVSLAPESQGVGFLFSVPEADIRRGLEEGYCLWLGSASHPSHRLFRNNVQVLEANAIYLDPKKSHHIRIEKNEDQIKLYINHHLKISFVSYLPITGSHVGFLYKDGSFAVKNLKIYSGSLNAMVNCLAVPNSFLSHRLYDIALQEYRRIGQCFPGRVEGREALFRAGLTLLEKGKSLNDPKYYSSALKEFEQLFKTPGAPLEYLGKSLVYEAMSDAEEEAKCLELALRKFPRHPLTPMIQEHVIYRMHESSLKTREAAYRIILLAIRHIPILGQISDTQELLDSLQKNWEHLPFIEDDPDRMTLIAIKLCFWLRKVPTLVEIAKEIVKKEPLNQTLLGNILYCLVELDAQEEIQSFPLVASIDRLFFSFDQEIPEVWTKRETRIFYYLIKNALSMRNFKELASCFERLDKVQMMKEDRILFDSFELWYHLLQKQIKNAEMIFRKYPSTLLTQENSPLHFPFGTWLYLVKGPKMAKAHFSAVLDTPFPPTAALPSHFMSDRIDEKKGWMNQAFWWEKKELHRLLELFHSVVGKQTK